MVNSIDQLLPENISQMAEHFSNIDPESEAFKREQNDFTEVIYPWVRAKVLSNFLSKNLEPHIDDIIQAALIKFSLQEILRKYDPNRPFPAWAQSVIFHAGTDEIRRLRRQARGTTKARRDETNENEEEVREAREKLKTAILQVLRQRPNIREKDLLIAELRQDGLGCQEITRIMREEHGETLNENGVKAIVFRMRTYIENRLLSPRGYHDFSYYSKVDKDKEKRRKHLDWAHKHGIIKGIKVFGMIYIDDASFERLVYIETVDRQNMEYIREHEWINFSLLDGRTKGILRNYYPEAIKTLTFFQGWPSLQFVDPAVVASIDPPRRRNNR